ncbi:MAG: cyclase family protein [Bdellovibrionota bacterium]
MALPDYYDISPEISEGIAVFPGDTPYRRTAVMGFAQGDHLGLSKIETTVHLGAHVDAPNHYVRSGQGMSDRSLHYYRGECQVMEIQLPRGSRIRASHLKPVKAPRVLFKTLSYPDPNRWNGDFNALSAELIDALAAKGVILVGIDTPSVDPAEDQALETHQAIARHNLANLEGIVLDQVPEGIYELTALPLKLQGADASPVRAVLWKK